MLRPLTARSTAFLSFSTSDTVPESAQRARAGCTKNGSMRPDARRALDAGDSPAARVRFTFRSTTYFATLLATPCCDAHGALFYPPPRNARDALLPKYQSGKGSDCNCGQRDAQANGCDVGTRAGLNGQGCFWFSQGPLLRFLPALFSSVNLILPRFVT